MANGVYIGVSDLARKVKAMYVGVDGVAKKVKKGYIGVNGVAQMFYSSAKYINFTSNPAPTTWGNHSSDYTSSSATNGYGTWSIGAGGVRNSSATFATYNAFDGNPTTTAWASQDLSSNTKLASITIYTPVPIKPSKISITCASWGTDGYIEGFDVDNNRWRKIADVTERYSRGTEVINVAGDYYYNTFKL
jgi:hypothetical protein